LALKHLLKRGALLAAANWQTIAIQFVAETTFQVLLAVPIIGAAILVAVLLGADLAELLQGSLRDIFTNIARALMSEPVALTAFIAAFSVVLVGGSALMFLVKGGTVDVMIAANAAAGPIEREAITFDNVRTGARFTLQRFIDGCARLFRPYLKLGVLLMIVYALSVGSALIVIVRGYQVASDRVLLAGWTFLAALTTIALVLWITLVNLIYLLMQISLAVEGGGLSRASRSLTRFVRAEFRNLVGVFLVVLVLIAAALFASALAWSGVGLIAFVPLVGLAVFPLQLAALLLRGLVLEYLGITALGAYVTLYSGYQARQSLVASASVEPSVTSASWWSAGRT